VTFEPLSLFHDGDICASSLAESKLDFRISRINLEKSESGSSYVWTWKVDPQNFPLVVDDLEEAITPLVYKVTLVVSRYQ